MKKFKDDTNRGKDISHSWIWRINFDYPIQGNLQIQCNPYQITNAFSPHKTRTKMF